MSLALYSHSLILSRIGWKLFLTTQGEHFKKFSEMQTTVARSEESVDYLRYICEVALNIVQIS